MHYKRFLDNEQEAFLLNLSKQHDVELSFSWEQDKKALKDALQKHADSMSVNSSELDMIFLTGELNRFLQIVNTIQNCIDNHGSKFAQFKKQWDKIISDIQG